jgi:hypothetical protein
MKCTGSGKRILVVAAFMMMGASGCFLSPDALLPAPEPARSSSAATTFILIRHAERDPGVDPPLNADGQLRAQALLDALRASGVTAIYCTDLLRNRQTVQPLADALGLPLHLVNPVRYVNTTVAADELVNEMLAADRGGTILFCGNIGSVLGTPGITEEIYHRLGGVGEGPNRYQDMFFVVLPVEGQARFIKAEYGGVSSLD